MPYLSRENLLSFGFKSIGKDVFISDKASFYNASNITIGSHVRIDDFCLLSAGDGGIYIGSFVHLSAYVSILGAEEVVIEDFVGISSKVSIFSSTDDYMGYGMTNPMVPSKYTRVKSLPVLLCKHSIIGANSVLLPGTILGQGVAVGALSVVSSSLDEWFVYVGNPVKKVVRRSRSLLEKEVALKNEYPQVHFI